jgi:hypothetical protein
MEVFLCQFYEDTDAQVLRFMNFSLFVLFVGPTIGYEKLSFDEILKAQRLMPVKKEN